MRTLKQHREKLGISQSEIANKTQIAQPTLCNYENGLAVPLLEDAIAIEKSFGRHLDWSPNEKIDEDSKQNILICINYLSERYPLISVINFVAKYIREGQKFHQPDKFIIHFAQVSQDNIGEVEPLSTTTGF